MRENSNFRKGVRSAMAVMLGMFLFTSLPAFAQDTEEENPFSMTVTLNSDRFFGFYPFFAGKYKMSEKVDFTFYGILWSGGVGGGWGNWTEFGAGIGFPVGSALYVSPQIGLLSGSLTSGLGTPVLGEGIVPNLTVTLGTDKLEGELYAGLYTGLDHGNTNTNNYLHYWLNTGYKFTSFFSAGLHYEHLRFTGGKNHADDSSYDFYQAIGPYVQFANPKGGAFARFSTGADIRSEEQVDKSNFQSPSFYKLTVGYSF